MPRASWLPSGHSRCTAGSARSWPASRSTPRCPSRTWTPSGPALPTWPSRSRTSGSSACRRSWRSTRSRRIHPAEHEAIREAALAAGARDAVLSTHFVDGGKGAEDLAAAVWAAAEEGAPNFAFLYPDDAPIATKIETVAERIYGADGVDLLPAAAKAIKQIEGLGFGNLPVNMAKTQYSLSHDPLLLGRPTGFRVPIRDVRLAAGAGFVTAYLGDMRTMPGLPTRPGGENIDIDANGEVVGLF